MSQKQDFFTGLGGRVKFTRGDYNITGDPVWLAAFIGQAYGTGHNILDAGIGTGGAALCLLAHAPGLKITGMDISETMLSECAVNAELNGRELELIHGDITAWRTDRTFDAVMTNPPYFKGTPRTGGAHHNVDLTDWTRACLRRVRPQGYFYCIVDAAATAEVIAALHAGKAGDINIVPLFGGAAHAERAMISACLNSRGGTKIHAGFSMNDDTVLRDGKVL
ncbi:MAG: methyltransferase domain-containing protein [Alphaproteobacteria bacterium]|nr:methyltransferase domain-containing protein [Alphaproteobacteria bacterium]